MGITTRLSSAHHPQTDGQTERTQQTWERYLRAYASESNWPSFLPLLEFTYNSAVHTSTGVPPFHLSRTYCPQVGFEPTPSPTEASEWASQYEERLEQARER